MYKIFFDRHPSRPTPAKSASAPHHAAAIAPFAHDAFTNGYANTAACNTLRFASAANRVETLAGVVSHGPDLAGDEHLAARKAVANLPHPELGKECSPSRGIVQKQETTKAAVALRVIHQGPRPCPGKLNLRVAFVERGLVSSTAGYPYMFNITGG